MRRYDGRPTAFHKLAAFLQQWDGTTIHSKAIREQLEISKAAWKDVFREEKMRVLLAENGVSLKGRGPNATWRRAEWSQSA